MEKYRKYKINIKLNTRKENEKIKENKRKEEEKREKVCIRFEDAFANLFI